MGTTRDVIRVFISSTAEDLVDHRAVARNVIAELQWYPAMYEFDLSAGRPATTIAACHELVDSCDLLLLIVAFRRGWVPSVEQGGDGVNSVTALELVRARNKGIPVLAMMADAETWPVKRSEQNAAAQEWVTRFRSELNQPAAFFQYERDPGLPDFKLKVRDVMLEHKRRLLEQRKFVVSGASAEEEREYLESAQRGLFDGSMIPFVGPEVHGDGPLGSVQLARALAVEPGGADPPSLATAAEHRESREDSRQRFLERFLDVLVEQQSQAEPLAIHRILSEAAKTRLIVSATCDETLESSLRAAGRSFAVVSHVVRSFDGEDDGKILVCRDERCELAWADKMPTLDDVDCVVYKPLGSPFLHRRLDPDRWIDTVVVTETDHLEFMMRLDNEHTRIPATLARRLAMQPILFLGYTLDAWQYRLLMKIYQNLAIRNRRASTLAVREPASHIEASAWSRLSARLIRMDPNDFAQRIVRHPEPVAR
ncbi:MAG: DUF4062 domain-containing protein [Phycisphaerales bacterium]